MKLFSPSLDMRSEPPNSQAVVMRVDGKFALVKFRGQSYSARMIEADIVAGESVAFIESPRNSYWIKRNGPSWYANPLKNWIAKGHKAQAALEYFLRKNPKWSPYRVIEGADGEPTLIETPGKPAILDDDGGLLSNVLGDFDAIDQDGDDFISRDEYFDALDLNGDGEISLEEWLLGGGTKEEFDLMDTNGDGRLSRDEWKAGTATGNLFKELDKDGDGKISREEWEQRTRRGGPKDPQLFQDRRGSGGITPPTPPVEPPEDPMHDFPLAPSQLWRIVCRIPNQAGYIERFAIPHGNLPCVALIAGGKSNVRASWVAGTGLLCWDESAYAGYITQPYQERPSGIVYNDEDGSLTYVIAGSNYDELESFALIPTFPEIIGPVIDTEFQSRPEYYFNLSRSEPAVIAVYNHDLELVSCQTATWAYKVDGNYAFGDGQSF